MKISILLLCSFLFSGSGIYGQTRVVYGKILDEYLETVGFARIQSSDSTILTKTDLQGKFKIEIPLEETKLIISGLGYEWTTIELSKDCENLEIILLLSGTYDLMSFRKIDRLGKKRFKELTYIRSEAFKKGIFSNMEPCYKQEFVPIKPRLEKNRKERQNE
ncbi:MAG: hypothetical protein EOO44_06385 [Flavobacterium sp.]|nr:MAG: hypothetical protein EOO44_06385 [Flavobacterium sp.]